MLLRPQPSQSAPLHGGRKRKADTQPDSNERLSKRLSLLNIEQNGAKLYVPVENAQRTDPASTYSPSPTPYLQPSPSYPPQPTAATPAAGDEVMQLDDTKHKVYIYNIDDELSSESEPDGDDRVVFLPDIGNHLRQNRLRIPRAVLTAREPEMDAADLARKQLVLYRVPRSISVPEEEDGVRKAIVEARQRVRERQAAEREASGRSLGRLGAGGRAQVAPVQWRDGGNAVVEAEDDPDAMELD